MKGTQETKVKEGGMKMGAEIEVMPLSVKE